MDSRRYAGVRVNCRTVTYDNESRLVKCHKILLLQSLLVPSTNARMLRLLCYKFGQNTPIMGAVAVSQVITGFGLGLLVAEKVKRSAREPAALALIGAGIAALVPAIVGVIDRVANRPTSRRLMKRRLEGIRRNSGLSETESV